MNALPPELEAERESLLREIDEAFAGVSREGSPSWSDAEWADILYEHSPQRTFARARDQESHWRELPDNPDWTGELDCGVGSWAFLDARAYRYYIPAAMVFCLRTGDGNGIDYQLTLHPIVATEPSPSDISLRKHSLEQWSMLDHAQRLCIYRFLTVMERIHVLSDREAWEGDWRSAIESYWSLYSEDAQKPL